MKKFFFLFVLLVTASQSFGQCLTSSLNISTGFDAVGDTGITGGAYAATPIPDPHWILTNVSPSVAIAISLTGLTEVVIGGNADVIKPAGSWITNPPLHPGGWISCINGNNYSTDGSGPSGTKYYMVLGRPFRMCSDDSILIDINIANDNYISATDIDGTPLGFSQPAVPATINFTSYAHFTKKVFLTAGTHTLNVRVDNYNDPTPEINPTGLNIWGSVSSVAGNNSLVSETYSSCADYVCSTSCNTLSVPDTVSVCKGLTVVIPATVSGSDSVLDVNWTPIVDLSTSTILNPTYTGITSREYYVTVESILPYNLVENGDFSKGNEGFSSSYTYLPPPDPILPEGEYSVYTDPKGVHSGFTSFGDHTTGTGNMMIINGASTPVDVWCETIPVLPNTTYDFSAWFANCSSVTVPPDVPTLQFRINGILQGVPTTVSTPVGVWVNFFTTWFSGPSTTATICIYDSQTAAAGNDFVIDDISFEQLCTAVDSIYVNVRNHDTAYTSKDTTACSSVGAVTLNAPGGYASYQWSTGSTATSISVTTNGNYRVFATTACFTVEDTIKFKYIVSPTVSIGNDTGFCIGNTVTLKSVQPFGYTYLWSDGTTNDTMNVSATGTYWLQVNDKGCTTTDSIHITVIDPPVVDLGPDTTICNGMIPTLQSTVTYPGGTSYLWNTGSTASSIPVSVTGNYWLQVTEKGCVGSDTIHVSLLYDTVHLYTPDTAICTGDTVFVHTGGNPLLNYQWVPTTGMPLSTVSSPIIVTDTPALYIMRASIAGCPDILDSFYLDVQPRPNVYVDLYRSVCQFDSLHINALVTPRWYTHYTYSWSPGTSIDNTNTSAVVFTPGGNTNLVVTVSTPAGCNAKDSTQIAVHPGNFASMDTVINLCPHDSVQLIPKGGVAYNWHPGIYLNDSTSATPWVKAVTSVDYTAVAYSEFGCRDTVSAKINVGPSAEMYLLDSMTLYPGESYQLSPQTNCVYFSWFPPMGLDNAYISNPVAMPEVSTKYTVVASNQWGCKITDSIYIFVDPETLLAVPNAFTPGNSTNGTFKIIKRGIATLNSFRVFNRWGNLVFETSNIDEGWDGTYNGVPQPFGVFVYEIDAVTSTGKPFIKHGNVTLIR